jgi:hypothetical protein
MTNNLPEPDDAPWLNLTPQEVEELRYNKQKLTKYGKEKFARLVKEGILKYNDALRKLAE